MAGIGIAGAAMVKQVIVTYLVLVTMVLPVSTIWKLAGVPAAVTPGALPIQVWHHMVDGLDGRACPSYPVCSIYAEEAVDRHGMLLGSWMALDRLIHEGGDLKNGQWVVIDDERRLYDPLERNTRWLNDGNK